MTKAFVVALVCAVSAVSMAQAQTSGSAGGGASVGAGTSGGGASGSTGITGGSSVVTPPASTGVGVSGGASGSTSQPAQPSIDTNQASSFPVTARSSTAKLFLTLRPTSCRARWIRCAREFARSGIRDFIQSMT